MKLRATAAAITAVASLMTPSIGYARPKLVAATPAANATVSKTNKISERAQAWWGCRLDAPQ